MQGRIFRLAALIMALLGGFGTILGVLTFLTGNESLDEFLGRTTEEPNPEIVVTINGNASDFLGQIVCSGSLPIRVQVGDTIEVTVSSGLRVRANAGSGGNVATLAQGAQAEIISGPRCGSGNTWWEVNTTEGDRGWVTEGDNQQYLIAPAN